MRVFVLDKNRKPLDLCHPARARQLLRTGRAAVFRREPFTIILKDRSVKESTVHPHRVKIDPGSKVTGITLVQEEAGRIVWAAELQHRGEGIKLRLLKRRTLRHSRRSRKTRYRKPRFLNRRRSEGWLPPSLQSRVENILTRTGRLRRYTPVSAISAELARFDMQKLQNPKISGVEYQRGELFSYEVWEYLLEKWGRRCAYCDTENVPLEKEHIIPKKRGGTDRMSNLAVACRTCNQAKGSLTAEEFGHPEVQARAKAPLKDAAAVNATRQALYRRLLAVGLPVEAGTGGRTKFNRTWLRLPKTHWADAACVGESTPEHLLIEKGSVLLIRATGHGRRQRCGTDKYGFPVRHTPRAKRYMDYQTGDMVRAAIPTGKYAGRHIGRVVIRFRPSFMLNGFHVHPKYLKILHRADGYEYTKGGSGTFSQA